MTMHVRFGMALVVIGLTGVVFSGCNDNPVGRRPITVKVTVAGEPLERGSVTFAPLPDSPSYQAGGQIVNGELHIPTLQGLPPGKYRAVFSVASAKADRSGGKHVIPDQLDRVPPEFNAQSKIVLEVTADGPNECVVDIPKLIN